MTNRSCRAVGQFGSAAFGSETRLNVRREEGIQHTPHCQSWNSMVPRWLRATQTESDTNEIRESPHTNRNPGGVLFIPPLFSAHGPKLMPAASCGSLREKRAESNRRVLLRGRPVTVFKVKDRLKRGTLHSAWRRVGHQTVRTERRF